MLLALHVITAEAVKAPGGGGGRGGKGGGVSMYGAGRRATSEMPSSGDIKRKSIREEFEDEP